MIKVMKQKKPCFAALLLVIACLAVLLAGAFAAPALAVSGEEIVLEAEKYLGYPYAWSAAGPNAFDCGGFTWYIYDQLGIDFGLRVSSADLAAKGEVIESADDLQLGDIVLFGYSAAAIGHWGIYSGYGYVIHSYNQSTGVVETPLSAVSPPFCYGVRLQDLPAYPAKAWQSGEPGQPSEWAAAEVGLAIDAGLIPDAAQGGYQQPMTRGEFCSLLLDICQAVFGQSREEMLACRGLSLDPFAFSDTRNEDILTAKALGLVNGRTDGTFGPDEPISRNTAALLLGRLLVFCGKEGIYDPARSLAVLAQDAVWYEAGLSACAAVDVAGGIAPLQPEPLQMTLPLSREQAFLGAMRLYTYLLTPAQPDGEFVIEPGTGSLILYGSL